MITGDGITKEENQAKSKTVLQKGDWMSQYTPATGADKTYLRNHNRSCF